LNLLINVAKAAGLFALKDKKSFALWTRG